MEKLFAGYFTLDLDDVVLDFWGTALPYLNNKFNKDIQFNEMVTYDAVTRHFPLEYSDFFDEIIKGRILENVSPYPGVKEFIQEIYERGYYINLVTSRSFHPNAFEVTSNSIKSFGIPFHELNIKTEGTTKADYIDGICDYFIDDLPLNIDSVVSSNKCRNPILVRRPWNHQFNSYPAVSCMTQVKDLIDL